jgi:hypothetical protein
MLTQFDEHSPFSKLCPQLIIGKVVGAGHFPTLEVPEQINSMIERFIKVYVHEDWMRSC